MDIKWGDMTIAFMILMLFAVALVGWAEQPAPEPLPAQRLVQFECRDQNGRVFLTLEGGFHSGKVKFNLPVHPQGLGVIVEGDCSLPR